MLRSDEAGHHDLAGVGADARGGGAGGEQRDREGERRAAADEPCRTPAWACWIDADAARARWCEELGGDREHRHVDEPGEAERDDHVEALEAQHARALAIVAARACARW